MTREADYAVRALLYLSRADSIDRPVSAACLAKEMQAPYRFMRRICLHLQRSGFVESRKGKGGGLFLSRHPSKISLLDVLREFDEGGLKLNGCLNNESFCGRSPICRVHEELKVLQELLESRLGSLSFDKLAE